MAMTAASLASSDLASDLGTGAAPAAQDPVETGLFEIVRKYLKSPDASWGPQTTMEEAQVDSLDLVELVFEIEDRFGVEVNFNANDRPVGELTFGDVVAMIRTALAAKDRAAKNRAAEARVAKAGAA